MSDSDAEGIISRDDISRLSHLFDRSEFAIDPLSDDCKQAESDLADEIRSLFNEKVFPIYPQITLPAFRCHVRKLCRDLLKKSPR
jgi:hypothetical protein